jgi:outer membrane scaffolding protein for murein synthesis (MipA/OmpV family)
MATVRPSALRPAATFMVAALASVCAAAPAGSADLFFDDPPPGVIEEIILDIGIGPRVQPEFIGASTYGVVPNPIIELQYLRLPGLGEMVTEERTLVTYALYPSIGFVGSRDAGNAPFLVGLDPIDFAIELGPGGSFRYGNVRVFAESRFGLTGHDGAVIESGFDFIRTPGERWEVSIGPRFSAATNAFMDTYFGVTPQEAARPETLVTAFDPGGGFKDVGFEGRVIYDLTSRVKVHGEARFSRFIGDAANSPIIEAGAKNQCEVAVGLTYRFGLDFSD